MHQLLQKNPCVGDRWISERTMTRTIEASLDQIDRAISWRSPHGPPACHCIDADRDKTPLARLTGRRYQRPREANATSARATDPLRAWSFKEPHGVIAIVVSQDCQRAEVLMHIDLNEAITIYAKACKSRFGRRARKKVLETAQTLRASGDVEGAIVWERVAGELEQPR